MRMRLKKRKKKCVLKYFLFFAVLYYLLDLNIKRYSFENKNEEFVNKILHSSNLYLVTNEDYNVDFIGMVSNIEVDNPVSMIDSTFVYKTEPEVFNNLEFFYIQNTVVDKPRVYIYSTHPSEKYEDDLSVVEASLILQERLNSVGIQTIVEPRNADTYVKQNSEVKDSYSASRIFLKDALNDNDFDLIIDLHRDKVPSTMTTKVEINGKNYAKVMFVMNKKYSNNYAFAEKINKIIYDKYPTITRGIYEKYVDSFNQDLNDNVILIELGSTQNDSVEVSNSIDILVETIKEILYEG